MPLLAIKLNTMWLSTTGQCEQCVAKNEDVAKVKGRRNVEQKWDQSVKWGNDMTKDIVQMYIVEYISVQLQSLKNIFCCERKLTAGVNAFVKLVNSNN